jgi:hypothetical protein
VPIEWSAQDEEEAAAAATTTPDAQAELRAH